jgi:hypothetical protein
MSNLHISGLQIDDNLMINSAGYYYEKEIVVPPGQQSIQFSCDAQRLPAPNDPRTIIFGVFNFQMVEIE